MLKFLRRMVNAAPIAVLLLVVVGLFAGLQALRHREFAVMSKQRADTKVLEDFARVSLWPVKDGGEPPEAIPMSRLVDDSEGLAKANATALNTTSLLLQPNEHLPRTRDAFADLPFAYWIHGPWLVFAAPGPDGAYELASPTLPVPEDGDAKKQLLVSFAYDPTNGTESAGDILRIEPWGGEEGSKP